MSRTEHLGSTGVAIVGAGLVGLGWAIVFARAGLKVRVFDRSKELVATLPAKLEQSLSDLESFGLIEAPQEIGSRVSYCDTLEEAVDGIRYVQESVLERVDVKRALYEQLDGMLGQNTIVGSSSSGIPSSDFTEGLSISPRCLVAHPVNPPYLVPVVELVPASWTLPEVVDQVDDLMHAVGQHPVRVARELRGFVLNRLQGVLLREAWALFEEGYCSTADLDATISKGLGLRWSFIGPFETIDLNAPGGVRDYANRLGGLYLDIVRERGEPQPWSEELIARVDAERRDALPLDGLQDRTEWRDRRLMAVAAHKRDMEASE
ncbi:3-hydroxyacyl-CoA dehydrogenase [Oricola nitratireducens]|uniref:3-hydroxyacyl-CoA dehydrogenase n=1 Tax=Oricola nitratireducens TaxID=2775868 RepID=UPI001866C07B|nr:3-hydroxyacyl-CoA dehydrogenase [Oricola nitratireducens]